MRLYLNYTLLVLILAVTIINLSSCSATKQVKYFQDIADSGQLSAIPKAEYTEPRIQVDDIMTVIVQTIDPAATQGINMGNIPASSSGTGIGATANTAQLTTSGYLVDKAGFIEIPIIGKVKMVNLTTTEAAEIIKSKAAESFKKPTVLVRFANFRVNVTGEVGRPGTYLMPGEKNTVLDAIAMAGDLTIFGKRDNVLLIRENLDGTKTPYRINLNKSDMMSKPYYYLRQNDMIYIEPGKGKAASLNAARTQTLAIVGSLLSVLIVAFTRL